MPDEIQELMAQVAELTEQVRVLELRNADQAAYITELQHRDPVQASRKSMWFGYKNQTETERGAFDIFHVIGWKAILKARTGWSLKVYVGCGDAVFELDDPTAKIFWPRLDKYIEQGI